MELVPQFFRLEAAGDLGHLLAGDAGARRNERLGTQRSAAAAAAAAAAAEVTVGFQRRQVCEVWMARRLLHELF